MKDVADAFKFYDSNLHGENMDLSKCRPKPNFATGKEKNYRLVNGTVTSFFFSMTSALHKNGSLKNMQSRQTKFDKK